MKRIILISLCFIGINATITAGKDRAISIEQLPQNAKELINTYFSDLKISYAKMDKEIFDTSYEVVFTNGSKIEFNRKGNWTDIECRNGIPKEIIPIRIWEYIHEHHPGQNAIEMELDRGGYEIKLDNGLEMKFDKKFRMRGYDN